MSATSKKKTTPRFHRSTDPKLDSVKADKNQLFKFDPSRGDGRFTLESLVGSDEINAIIASGSLEFSAVGDTGKGDNTEQSEVADAMARDFVADAPAKGSTFFLNLGDIIYGPGKESGYANKFYRPNKAWLQPAPGFKGIILGIPGNHDGEVRDPRDKPSLSAFLENFCQKTGADAPMAKSFGVTMPNQPGPYWWLDAPFIDLIGLYSNAAEDFGILGINAQDTAQQDWLANSLKVVAKNRKAGTRKALVIASHHPPYNAGLSETAKGHPGSPQMLAQIDAACKSAGIWPDMYISGHSHNYQHYTRTLQVDGKSKIIPYLIAGTGGIGSQPVPQNIGNMNADKSVSYDNALGSKSKEETVYGYLRMHASKSIVQSTFVQTLSDHRQDFETVAIDLATGQKTNPVFD
jgi:hypothetical protein